MVLVRSNSCILHYTQEVSYQRALKYSKHHLFQSFFQVLNAAVAMIFNDFMKRDTYLRALQTYSALHIKANSLHQWISMVLEKTITRDLEQIVPLWQKKMVALKRERLK